MKKITLSVMGLAAALLMITAALVNRSFASKTNKSIAGDGFAVMELFTSEGCSSCPPADELLARIQQEAGDKPIYILAYHVDYWDHQGWKDVFDSPLFSQRQYDYSKQFAGQVYTPQVIVNGKSEFVGSNEDAANLALKKALSANPSHVLKLEGHQTARKMKIDYQLTGDIQDNRLVIALIEKHAVSKVTRGENQGRTLSHAQIVRKLYSFNLKSGNSGSEEIEVPAEFNAADWEVIGLLQSPDNHVINAASRVAITSTP
jgi:hypothetical protein